MLRKPRFAFAFVFLLALGVWALEPIFDQGGDEVVDLSADGLANIESRTCIVICDIGDGQVQCEQVCFGEGGGGSQTPAPPPLKNPLVAKFFPATFVPGGGAMQRRATLPSSQ
jgi:hypothetical protein